MTGVGKALLARRALWFVLGLAFALMLVPAVASAVTLGTVHGTVVDADTGEAVSDADVSLWGFETEEYYDAVTNIDGEFVITGVLPGDYMVETIASGYEESYRDTTIVAGENALEIELIAVDPTVSGTVTGPDSQPIVDADVECYVYAADDGEWWAVDYTSTDDEGRWGMDVESGVYRFGFWADGFSQQYFSNAGTIEQGRNVTVWPFKSVTGINAKLIAEVPSITGKVVDASNGAAVADAAVLLVTPDPEGDPEFPYMFVDETMTDPSGAYSFGDLEPGEYYVLAAAQGYRPEWHENVSDLSEATAVPFSGTVVTGIDFELSPADVSISGTVTSAETGLPLAEATVEVFKLDGGEWVSEEVFTQWTAEDGAYAVYDLPDGTYRVGFTGAEPIWPSDEMFEGSFDGPTYYGPSFWNGASTVEAATDIVVNGTQQSDGYDLVLPEAVASVTGRLTAAGAPLAGEWVNAYTYSDEEESWEYVGDARTAEDGTYEIYGLSGTVRVGIDGAYDPESEAIYGPAYWNGKTTITEATDITAVPGTTVSGIDLALTEATPLVRATVVNEVGEPVEFAFAMAYQESSNDEEGDGWQFVGAGPVFEGELEILPEGPVDYDRPIRVEVQAEFGYLPEFFNNARTIETATDIDITPGVTVTLPQIKLDPYVPIAVRVSSTTRYSTSVAMAKRFTDDWDGVEHVILASGEDRAAADPLAASGLSWAYNGAPVLLTPAGSTPQPIIDAVKAIVAKNGGVSIHIVGGEKSVPKARVSDILKALGGNADAVDVDRIAGANRFDNARLIANRMREVRPDMPDFALVANGADPTKFFDALALSAVSANTGAPILLVSADSVPAPTAAALKSLPITKGNVFVAGGTNTVTSRVLKQLGTSEANRLSGRTRFSTAIAVSQWAIENGWLTDSVVGVAAKLPDALSGGALVGARGGSLLVTDGTRLSSETGAYLTEIAPALMENTPAEVYVFGGEQSVSKSVLKSISALLSVEESDF